MQKSDTATSSSLCVEAQGHDDMIGLRNEKCCTAVHAKRVNGLVI